MGWLEGSNEVEVASSVPGVECAQPTCINQLQKSALINQHIHQQYTVVKLYGHLPNASYMSEVVVTAAVKEKSMKEAHP